MKLPFSILRLVLLSQGRWKGRLCLQFILVAKIWGEEILLRLMYVPSDPKGDTPLKIERMAMLQNSPAHSKTLGALASTASFSFLSRQFTTTWWCDLGNNWAHVVNVSPSLAIKTIKQGQWDGLMGKGDLNTILWAHTKVKRTPLYKVTLWPPNMPQPIPNNKFKMLKMKEMFKIKPSQDRRTYKSLHSAWHLSAVKSGVLVPGEDAEVKGTYCSCREL